jgi:hypothetical protein
MGFITKERVISKNLSQNVVIFPFFIRVILEQDIGKDLIVETLQVEGSEVKYTVGWTCIMQ